MVTSIGLTLSPPLFAEDARREAILAVNGPPTRPGLSHSGTAFGFEYTLSSSEPTDPASFEPLVGERAYAYAARLWVEVPIVERHWYFGWSSDAAAASVPASSAPDSGGSTFVFGNPELWARGMWVSPSGLGAGGGAAVTLPLPRTFSDDEREVVRAIRVVQPWDYSHYQDLTLTVRPFFDLRHVVGPVTFQLRQGLDISVLLRDRAEHENRYDLTALANVYVGMTPIDAVTLGLEFTEVYQITADVSSPSCIAPCDEHRAAQALSPSIRLELPRISPTVSAIFPIASPLRGEVASYYALRVHLAFSLAGDG